MTANWLMLFKQIIHIYSENHMKAVNKLCGQNEELMVIKESGRALNDEFSCGSLQ
jgi:hypothetical protein